MLECAKIIFFMLYTINLIRFHAEILLTLVTSTKIQLGITDLTVVFPFNARRGLVGWLFLV